MAGEVVGTAYVEIRPKTDGFANEAQSKIAAPLQAAFAGIATGVVAAKVKSFFTSSFSEATDAAKVTAQLGAVLKSTGEAAGVTAEHATELATKLQKVAAVDDDVIKRGEALLLTFRSVTNQVGAGNDIFDRATAAALDMSAALGTDLQGSVIQLGKALNDPIQGLTALRRVGVSFTEQQKEQITTLQQSGDLLGAQKIILDELAKEFGGAAASQATATKQLAVAFGNLKESIGTALLPIINALAKALQPLAEFLSQNKIAATALAVVISGALLLALAGWTVGAIRATAANLGLAASSHVAAAAASEEAASGLLVASAWGTVTPAVAGAGVAAEASAGGFAALAGVLGPVAVGAALIVGTYIGLKQAFGDGGQQISVNTRELARLTDAQLKQNAAATLAAFGQKGFNDAVAKTAKDSPDLARKLVEAADLPRKAHDELIKSIDKEEAAQKRAAAALGGTTNALDDQTDSTRDLVDWVNILNGKLNDQVDASLSSQGAAVSMDRAIQNLNETLATNAANTLEGRDAIIQAETSVVSFGKKIYDERLAVSDSTQATRDQIGALEGVRDSLAPGSPLRTFLDGYINQLRNDIPGEVHTNFLLTLANETGLSVADLRGFEVLGSVLPHFASGGIIPGPVGQPRLVVAHGGEEVVPVGGSSTSGGDVHFHIEGQIPDPVTFGLRTARVQRVYMQMAGR